VTAPPLPPRASWLPLLERALAEDVGTGDVTGAAVLAADASACGVIEARAPLLVCGLPIAEAAFALLEPALRAERGRAEGATAPAGAELLRIEGPARALLAGERTALNFLARLSGIATHTRRFVEAVAGTGVEILDTRKTLPGWRVLDKYAVAVGGGRNHRFGLYDGVLIKDNHLRAAGSVAAAVERARAATELPLEVECDTLEQVGEALDAEADAILLDNMTLAQLREAVALAGGRARLEASGGITLENVRAVAETGVDEISIGALTHSARSLDVSLEVA
jgi:nicotinate-nucleotide pyrophosphorylase (carboxylating)